MGGTEAMILVGAKPGRECTETHPLASQPRDNHRTSLAHKCDCCLMHSKQLPKGQSRCPGDRSSADFALVTTNIKGPKGRGKKVEFYLYSHLWDKRTSKESAHLMASSVDSLLE